MLFKFVIGFLLFSLAVMAGLQKARISLLFILRALMEAEVFPSR